MPAIVSSSPEHLPLINWKRNNATSTANVATTGNGTRGAPDQHRPGLVRCTQPGPAQAVHWPPRWPHGHLLQPHAAVRSPARSHRAMRPDHIAPCCSSAARANWRCSGLRSDQKLACTTRGRRRALRKVRAVILRMRKVRFRAYEEVPGSSPGRLP